MIEILTIVACTLLGVGIGYALGTSEKKTPSVGGFTPPSVGGTVDLTSEVTGALPIANGGTGSTAVATGTDVDTGTDNAKYVTSKAIADSGVVTTETDPVVGAITGIVKADGGGNISAAVADTDYQSVLSTATTSAEGKVELATTAEINTGTDTTRAIPVDQFVASNRNLRFLEFRLIDSATDVAADTTIGGDFVVPFAGTIIQDDSNPYYFCAWNDTAGVTGTMVVDVNLGGTTIMTTNKLDIETGEKSTGTAATQPDVTTTAISAGDILTFDIDSIHSGTAAKGLTVRIPIRLT